MSHLRSRYRRALTFLRPHRWACAAIVAIALALAGLSAVEPLLLRHVFDHLSGPAAMKAVLTGIVALALVALTRELASSLSNWLTWRTRIGVHFGLLEATVGRLHSLPVSYHRAEGVGATMTRLDRGIQGLVSAVSELALNVVPAVAYLGIAAVVLIRLDLRLALLVIALAPVPALITGFYAPVQATRERTLLDRWAKIYSRFNEVLSGIVTVKSFAMEAAEKRRFLSSVDEANAVVVRGVAVDSGVGAMQNLVMAAARIGVVAFGGVLAVRGEITAGTLIAALGYVGGLFAPVQGLTGAYKTVRLASVSLEQVFSILDADDPLVDAPAARALHGVRGEVSFEGVRFEYDARRPLLHGVDLHVRAGENLALVGPSGAGKTTLMALLQRLYDPSAGAIRIDGHDLRELQQASIRRSIGVVLQEPLLFNESVRDNIAYGRPEASQVEIEAAAKAAHAHELIATLPQGYDTPVGERGGRLSAGERQRIAIARALLKDPPILILDEPTSALDAESEALIQEALQRLVRGRTTFSIAHRLSTVVDADRVVVMKDGRISESGTHRELLRSDGYYASLVRRQARGLIMQPG
jgi:ATP-binding cassette, subfamily B, bacterial